MSSGLAKGLAGLGRCPDTYYTYTVFIQDLSRRLDILKVADLYDQPTTPVVYLGSEEAMQRSRHTVQYRKAFDRMKESEHTVYVE